MLDLTNLDAIPAALDRLAPDIIINPAAYTAVDKAEDEPELAMLINGDAPGMIARWAADRAVPFIHFSTDYVFDGSGTRPWREDDPAHPLSAYGRSKLAGENQIRAAGGVSLVIRTSWVFSASGTNFLRRIVLLARERNELRIVDDQIGAPTSATVIGRTIADILGGGRSPFVERCSQAGGVIHLAASGETSRHDLANAIVVGLRARGVALAVERVTATVSRDNPTRAHRPLNSRLDTTRLRLVFGIALPDWRPALEDELDIIARELSSSGPPG